MKLASASELRRAPATLYPWLTKLASPLSSLLTGAASEQWELRLRETVEMKRGGRLMSTHPLHPGIEPDQVSENTSFEVHGLDEAEQTRLPTADELKLIREVIDPKALRDKEVRT